MKVRLKPLTYSAHQWFASSPHPDVRALPAGAAANKICNSCSSPMREHGYTVGRGGTLRVCPGNWVLTAPRLDPIVVRDVELRTKYEEELHAADETD